MCSDSSVQLCVLCGVFLERELPNGNGHINVQLHDVLVITLGLQHFRLYWRSGQAKIDFVVSLTNLVMKTVNKE